MSRYFSLFFLLKPTLMFFFDFKRLWRLSAVPVAVVIVMICIERFFPVLSLSDTAEVNVEVDYYALSAFTVLFLALFLDVMFKVQQVIFFSEDGDEKYFIPKPDKGFFKYLLSFFLLIGQSFFLSAVSAVVVAMVLKMLLNLPPVNAVYVLIGAALLFPYFMIRLSPLMPAAAAGDKIKFLTAWKMTHQSGVLLTFYYGLSAVFPLLIVSLLYPVLFKIMPQSELTMVFFNLLAVIAVLFSCMSQAAFMAYSYPVLKERV